MSYGVSGLGLRNRVSARLAVQSVWISLLLLCYSLTEFKFKPLKLRLRTPRQTTV